MLKSRLACITGMCILSSSSLGTAAEFEKSGDAEYDTYYVSKTLAEIPSSELGRSGIDQFSGITRNVKGESPFDRMSVPLHRALDGHPQQTVYSERLLRRNGCGRRQHPDDVGWGS